MNNQRIIELSRLLTEAPGVAGREEGAAEIAREILCKLGKPQTSRLGSVWCTVSEGEADAPHIVLEAHLDQIGLVVTRVEENGFLRISSVGGFDRRTLPAAPVTVHADSGSYAGVICSVPPHLVKGESKIPAIDELAVDVGFEGKKSAELFHPGDIITLDSRFAVMCGDTVCGAAMDNRLGCVSVLAAAEEIKAAGSRCRVSVLLSAMEEIGGHGAATSGFELRPDMAIVVDVAFASGCGAPKGSKCGEMGKGAQVGIAPILNREMIRTLLRIANEQDIPTQPDVMGGRTGTDADELAIAAGGIPTALLSIPLRNMHSVAETARVEDIATVARLMAAFVKEA